MLVTKFTKLLVVGLALAAVLTGCGRSPAPETGGNRTASPPFLSLTDDVGRAVALPRQPEKIIVLSASFLDLLSAVDGKVIGRPSSKTGEIPAAAQSAEEIGYVYNINIEKVVALQPDLVIAYQGIHEKLLPILESNQIPVMMVRMRTYQDVVDKLKLFGRIAGSGGKGEALAGQLEEQRAALLDKVPERAVKVAILHATAKNVTVELENSIAGSIAQQLRLRNVATGSRPLESDPDATPYSLEKLVEADPDMIFVVTMGQAEDIEKRMKADVESNPAWSALAAVQNKQVFFLPQELFLLNPGLKYPQAVEYMARLAYPEAFADGQ
ncbi:iron complex transport system substrate-binding protein [Dendrosporobacter quercicolus]|uniref:Iron complex transport system substrate-binding protein n=1 Tax=Dendrosporobacter quercicolus TaxID=146817 RepID=A0A1G9R0J3_9FIRM|nr:ABC transporter substrate-binding protein [Dendrosporobacter quercicolus]SDM15985.1 iron complex transport system substrate-binding protein [Dendrosporobacter quercicolus]